MNGETKPSSIQLGSRRLLRKRKEHQHCCFMCTNTSLVKVMNKERKQSTVKLGSRKFLRKQKKDPQSSTSTDTSLVKVMNKERKQSTVKLGSRKFLRKQKKDPESSMPTGASQMNVMSYDIKPCFVYLELLKVPQIHKLTAEPSFCMEGLSRSERIDSRIDQWLNSMEIVWPQCLLDLNDSEEDDYCGTASGIFRIDRDRWTAYGKLLFRFLKG